MAWSLLTPYVGAILNSAEAQRNEPGNNAVDNCGPADISCLMQIHGYPDIEPQDLVGPYYRGGTTGPQLNAIVAKRYPNPPPMSYVSSTDPIGDLAKWAAKGWLSMGLFWSDSAAVVKPYNTGIGHWCIPVEDDGTLITLWNSEWGTFDRLSHADFLKASWHQFDVCQRPIPQEDQMTQDDFRALFRVACVAARGGEPDPDLLTNFANNYSGSNAEALITQLIDDPTISVPYMKKRSAVIAAGPATPGAVVDTAQFAKVIHEHDVSGKAK